MWALARMELWDEELWKGLIKKVEEKEFNYMVVKNGRWTAH